MFRAFRRLLENAKRAEQLEVQLAGCAVAAQGWAHGPNACKPGDYGWSPAFDDVMKLRTFVEDRHKDEWVQYLQDDGR